MTAMLDLPAFRFEGLCAQTDPELFFPTKGKSGDPAKAICRLCPVRQECLAYALERHERIGVWGGTVSSEREEMRKHRQAAAA